MKLNLQVGILSSGKLGLEQERNRSSAQRGILRAMEIKIIAEEEPNTAKLIVLQQGHQLISPAAHFLPLLWHAQGSLWVGTGAYSKIYGAAGEV